MKFSSTVLLAVYGVITFVGHKANAVSEEQPSFVSESSSSFNEPTNNMGVNHNRLVVSVKDGIASRLSAMRGAKIGQRFADGELEVVEFDKDADRMEFLAQANSAGLTVEYDPPIFPYGVQIGHNVSRNLQEQVPWGINDVFTREDGTVDIPGPDYYPSETRHVCIIDSGYQDSHPDLVTTASNADPSQGSSYKEDGCKHGTHVAGTILATDNNVGVIGVFPGASAFIVKVFGFSGSTSCGWSYSSSLVAAAQHCRDRGADIISMSLGGGGSTNFERDAFQTLNDVNGILSIAAAGNAGNGAFSYPASYDSIMSVGATDINKNIASFSQYNSQVDISGPGVSVRSTVGTNGYSSYSGTSMATPHVSGVALLLWNKYPTCTNNEIREALEGSALDRGATGKDIYFGHGIVRYWDAVAFLENKPCGNSGTPPTPTPVNAPISTPTPAPSSTPTLAPFSPTAPTTNSTFLPSMSLPPISPTAPTAPSPTLPTLAPFSPTAPTTNSTILPTLAPISRIPTPRPTTPSPTLPTLAPFSPTAPTTNSTILPTLAPISRIPTPRPTTPSPTLPTLAPFSSTAPTTNSTFLPSMSLPTISPTAPTTPSPTLPTLAPISRIPTPRPTTPRPTTPQPTTPRPTTPQPNSPPSGNPSECGSNEAELVIIVQTDEYPAETNWKVENVCTETIVLKKQQVYQKNKEHHHEYCVPNDQGYSFTISDSYGDGICCSYGDGKYSVTYDSNEVKSGGQFGASESTSFGRCSSTIAPSVSPTSNATSNSTTSWDEVFFNDFERPNKFGDFTKGGNMAGWHGKGEHSFSGKGALFIRHGLGKRSAYISRPFDVSDYTEVKVDFMFKAVGTEIGDGFALEYSVDGGIKYFTGKVWKRGTEFTNGEYYAIVENIVVESYFDMMRIRFIALGNHKNDRIYIDDVSVMGALYGEGGSGSDEDVM